MKDLSRELEIKLHDVSGERANLYFKYTYINRVTPFDINCDFYDASIENPTEMQLQEGFDRGVYIYLKQVIASAARHYQQITSNVIISFCSVDRVPRHSFSMRCA